jgi:hypothetical protein
MDDVKRVVSNLVQTLEARQKEATDLVDTMHQLQSYLDGESKNIIQGGLDRLLTTISAEAMKLTGGMISRWQVVVLGSPEGRVSVKEIYGDENSAPWLTRLKSEGFHVMTLHVFSSFIQSLKSEVAEGNLIPIIEFLKANAKIEMPLVYPDASAVLAVEQPREPSTSPRWKPSDFLPARFSHPPLPRGLFKD